MASSPPLPRLGWLLLGGITIFWGTNWVALKICLSEIPVWQYRAVTCTCGGLGLLLIARLAGYPTRVPGYSWGPMAGSALFNVTAWHIFSAYGVRLVGSGEAAVLAFTMPVWATLLGCAFLGERLTPRVLGALLLSAAAILVLVSADLGALAAAPLGVLLMLGAALSWAVGTIIQKRVRWPLPVITVSGWQLVIGAVPIVLVAAATEPFLLPAASSKALWWLLYTILLPMLFCYYAWYKVVSLFPASIAGIGTMMVPVVGILSGALLLGEPLGWRQIAALLCVIAAIALILLPPLPGRAASRG